MQQAGKIIFLFCAPLLLLIMSLWLSSGTLNPMNLTGNPAPIVEPTCSYLLNCDDGIHYELYRLAKNPTREGFGNMMSRRILYPVIALPFMSELGYIMGGFVATVIFYLITFVIFITYCKSKFGISTACLGSWLFASYPGIAYWGGLPYFYSIIIPSSLLLMILLDSLQSSRNVFNAMTKTFAMGILFLGYDFAPIYILALAIFLFFYKRSWIIPGCVSALLPTLLYLGTLYLYLAVQFNDSNYSSYLHIINSYLGPISLEHWWSLLQESPKIFIHNFFYSCFLFLPILFLSIRFVNGTTSETFQFSLPEKALFSSFMLLWIFNNFAPPYPGWQMRGYWIARIYQPLYAPLLFYILRYYYLSWSYPGVHKRLKVLICITVLLNSSISFGSITMNPVADHVFHNFYQHGVPGNMIKGLKKYGRRPLGFCKPPGIIPD